MRNEFVVRLGPNSSYWGSHIGSELRRLVRHRNAVDLGCESVNVVAQGQNVTLCSGFGHDQLANWLPWLLKLSNGNAKVIRSESGVEATTSLEPLPTENKIERRHLPRRP
jgi:hypothetical protein